MWCVRNTVDCIINDKWYADRMHRAENDAERIVTGAAKLILGNILAAEFDCCYSPSNDILESREKGNEGLPPLLQLFLDRLIKYPFHQVSIGQCTGDATRHRSCIPPVPFGFGTEVDNVFRSKWLLSELSALQFSVSSREILRYKQSVTENEDTSDFLREYLSGSFTQRLAMWATTL